MGYNPWGHKESDTTEQLTHTHTCVHTHTHTHTMPCWRGLDPPIYPLPTISRVGMVPTSQGCNWQVSGPGQCSCIFACSSQSPSHTTAREQGCVPQQIPVRRMLACVGVGCRGSQEANQRAAACTCWPSRPLDVGKELVGQRCRCSSNPLPHQNT